MKNLLFILTVLLVVSCGQKSNNNTEKSSKEQENTSDLSSSTFEINSIPVSTADIGTFPYLTPPEGYEKDDRRTQDKRFEEKFFFLNDSISMSIKGKYYHAFIRPKEAEVFSEAYIVHSYEKAIKDLGGILIYEGEIPDNTETYLLDKNRMPYSLDLASFTTCTYKQFVLRTPNGNVWFEICFGDMSSKGIDYTVMYEGELVQTIKIVKVDELKSAIDKEGKAVLYINFDTDRSTLKLDGVQAVEEIAKLMKDNPALELSIEGHTDNTGTTSHNQKLSFDRAQSVVKKLEELNIAGSRLKAVGYGSEKPLVPNDSEENKVKNRRVEIVKI